MIYPPPSIIDKIKATNGALSVCESIAIINLASQAPQGLYLELGVWHGKSAMSAAFALQKGTFILVDPIFEDDKIADLVINNVSEVNNKHTYAISPRLSFSVIPQHRDYTYVMVDSGSHQDGLPMQEVKLLEDKIAKGGIVVFHDWNSQFKEVKEAADYLVNTGKYEYMPIDWDSIIKYVNINNLEANNDSWHHNELPFPCFIGALKRI